MAKSTDRLSPSRIFVRTTLRNGGVVRRKVRAMFPFSAMSRLHKYFFLLFTLVAAVPCPASHVEPRALRSTKSLVVTTGRRVWLAYPHAGPGAHVYGSQQLPVTPQSAPCILSSGRQRHSGVCFSRGPKELIAFVATSGIPPGGAFPATYSGVPAACKSPGIRSRASVCIRSRTPQWLAAQTLSATPHLTSSADFCGHGEELCGLFRLTDVRQGVRLYSAGPVASRVPLSTKQLKTRSAVVLPNDSQPHFTLIRTPSRHRCPSHALALRFD